MRKKRQSEIKTGELLGIKAHKIAWPLRADMYRQKAAEAKIRAAEASNPHVKSAFTEVARGWQLLAEQMEWMEHQDEAKEGEIPH